MRNPQSAYIYIVKNIGTLLLMVLSPAIVLSLSHDNKTIPSFFAVIIRNIDSFTIKDYFSDVYSYFTSISFNSFPSFLLWVFGLLILIACLGMTFSSVEKKMRLGVSSGIKWLDLINDSIMVVLPYVALLLLGYELVALTCSGMIALLFAIIKNTTVFFIISLLFTVILFAFYLVLFVYLSLTVPCMMSDGYSFRFAASYSIALVQKEFKKVMMSFLLPLLGCIALSCIVSAVTVFSEASDSVSLFLSSVVHFLCMLFYLMCFPVLSMKNYMTLTGEKRRDLWNWR